MITLTPAAARQIRESAKQGKMEGMGLRIAAMRQPDNGLHYAMGFDDTQLEGDQVFKSEGIDIVVAASSFSLLQGMTVDFVELEPGRHQFIFLNPNDPNYKPKDADTRGAGSAPAV